MKNKLLILLILLINQLSIGQTINIPDTNFKNALLNEFPIIDTNSDGEIQVSEAISVTSIQVGGENISDLTGIEEFVNLTLLRADNNNISTVDLSQNLSLKNLFLNNNNLNNLDLSQNIQLERINISSNNFTSFDTSIFPDLKDLNVSYNNINVIDVSQNPELTILSCDSTGLNTLDLSQNPNLIHLYCSYNELLSLDLSNNQNLIRLYCIYNNINLLDLTLHPNLEELICNNNNISSLNLTANSALNWLQCDFNNLQTIDLSTSPNLAFFTINNNYFLQNINLQNGNNQGLFGFSSLNNYNLETICVDDVSFAITNFTNIEPQTVFVDDCNITSINYNLIDGNLVYDELGNGCDVNDLPVPNIMVTTTDGSNDFSTFTQNDGSFLLDVADNSYTTSVNLPLHFNASPSTANSIFSDFGATDTQDFCATQNQLFNDLEVIFIPLEEARPGFDTDYQIIIKNNGVSTISNGSITLEFDDLNQSFVSSTPNFDSSTSNTFTFDFIDLIPFESRTIDFTLNTFQPPTVQSGDILNFTATIQPTSNDDNQENNTFVLSQEVVNSYDPNDITVLQGESIFIEEADEYLDYVIRFQNTGTASAINVVITHNLDNDFDWNSFMPISSSHDYRVQITNGNFVEFIFENINLPDMTSDEENSQGFVAFKVKPDSNAVVGDWFVASAKIYFDFNAPILTNFVGTEIVESLATSEFDHLEITIFPNPVSNNLNIKSKMPIDKLSIYNLSGQLVKTKFVANYLNYDLQTDDLSKGVYFLEVLGGYNKEVLKFIKE